MILLVAFTHINASTTKNLKTTTTKDSKAIIKSPSKTIKKSPPAILAIQIIDSKDNSTKNSKRTIDKSLGYGHNQNHFGVTSKPKLVYYKYSQQDIPPYRGPARTKGLGSYSQNEVNVQRSLEYQYHQAHQQPTQQPAQKQSDSYNVQQQQVPLSQYYQPGTTLFTTLNQNGHVSDLSSRIPQQVQEESTPVIYVKIYSDQLNQLANNEALYPNIPESHPNSNLNQVDLQSLLLSYVKNYQYQEQQPYYEQEQQQNYQNQMSYFNQQQIPSDYRQYYGANSLPTHENYPDNAHTRVVFRSNNYNNGHVSEESNGDVSQVLVPQKQTAELDQYQQTYSRPVSHQEQYIYNQPQGASQQEYFYYNPVQQYVQKSPDYQDQDVTVNQYQPQVSTTPKYVTQGLQMTAFYPQGDSTSGYNTKDLEAVVHRAGNSQTNFKGVSSQDPRDDHLLDTQKVHDAPYNYHAHSQVAKRRHLNRRPSVQILGESSENEN